MRIIHIMPMKPEKAEKIGTSLSFILGAHIGIYYLYVSVINIIVDQQYLNLLLWLSYDLLWYKIG